MSCLGKVKRYIKVKLGLTNIHIKYDAKKQRLKINCPYSFEDRAVKTVQMFMSAFEIAKPKVSNSFKMCITWEDFPVGEKCMLSYSKRDTDDNIIAIPDFCFLNWKESGMADYEKCWSEMVEASKKEPEFNTLFWIGNAATHPTRMTLCDIAENDDRIEAYGMNWKSKNGKNVPSKFVSLIDHTKYKYLIDVQGRGYSGRTKMLMFSGRPLFIADRPWKEFWNNDVVPFVHYIPVKEDLSDLVERVDWAESHPDECKQIAMNAQEYAMTHLRREDAINYFVDVIVNYSKKGSKV
ncbi:MAG: glycosyl transferase family 90 [Eubacterium sp.]